ncbi:uncharacterized protein SCHCODRAFT_02614775 [Schizophyllum commune H4-8]|uniref:uncharacterized protein n=1 Tax=Schizophyllum commune (strain H4-8 / FGSC 9210) TaxID=578458 RepID=UPI00215F4AE1|nr:uncharacterized protein SCHCODRAFT_02614775 [Schizophyllum commune H4-8]KAI5896411.1 hypothetical protein SCHCODRAFT_02614775 [Schizophyllum commune H4-8]
MASRHTQRHRQATTPPSTITKPDTSISSTTGTENTADIFTKALPIPAFEKLRTQLGVVERTNLPEEES